MLTRIPCRAVKDLFPHSRPRLKWERRYSSIRLSAERHQFLKHFVQANTELNSQDSLTPEISLRLITPNCGFFNATEQDLAQLKADHDIEAPFWGFWWPGGQSLARYALDHPHTVRGKKVLDLGAGGGGVGLACKRAGASYVCVNDIDTCALVACELNQDANGMVIDEYETRSLIGSDGQTDWNKRWDVIMAGDICYEEEFAIQALDWLRRQVAMGTDVFIGDPGRAYLPLTGPYIQLVHKYKLPKSLEEQNYGLVNGGVYRVL